MSKSDLTNKTNLFALLFVDVYFDEHSLLQIDSCPMLNYDGQYFPIDEKYRDQFSDVIHQNIAMRQKSWEYLSEKRGCDSCFIVSTVKIQKYE